MESGWVDRVSEVQNLEGCPGEQGQFNSSQKMILKLLSPGLEEGQTV